MSRRLIVLRHGQTEYNATKRMQGHLDTVLSDAGWAQAEAAADFLATLPIGKIVSSDLARAHDTATVVGQRLGVDVSTDQRLRETNLGDWQAKTHEEVDEHYPGARALWRHDATWAPPNGESRIHVAQRARAVVDELMRDYDEWDDCSVLLVAHGGTISALTSSLLGLHQEQYSMISGLGNTCWAQLTARPRFHGAASENAEKEAADYVDQLSARFTSQTVTDAQWYLEGWNMGVALGSNL
ncbi:histidine phosphatase family protein [Corynebacterium diphtheriae]|uniref:histidine phosphatase family protein n=1 Tax=Corynebacterium diphtheriae TaxID=1717 RepID=UPI0002468C87|nr:histidine phosphatase family protein [Corynebacterium diphtheriae]AEX70416.1 phosphoglycerate mutase [Corynebacterium diphtheriae PW8]AWR16515.1 phosphoglycerate mutase [Corynebacterium diphtheriae]OKY23309.1 histidine phosphatase [Corynebacterium diphtheriae]OWY00320.1 histidine phosphatase family protein [Corynebacterium diphtheriae]UEB39244.1 histidine phosphatase family protein [Corynebacterium diphtheriae]